MRRTGYAPTLAMRAGSDFILHGEACPSTSANQDLGWTRGLEVHTHPSPSSGQYLRLANGGVRSLGTNGRWLSFDAAIPFVSMDEIHDGASRAPVIVWIPMVGS